MEINRVEGYRKFCNKIWNATKFAMLKLDDDFVPPATLQVGNGLVIAQIWLKFVS